MRELIILVNILLLSAYNTIDNGTVLQNVKAGPETEEDMTVRVLKWCRKDTVKQAVLILLMLVTIMLGRIC